MTHFYSCIQVDLTSDVAMVQLPLSGLVFDLKTPVYNPFSHVSL